METYLTVERLIERSMKSNVTCKEAAKMIDVLFYDRRTNDILTAIINASQGSVMQTIKTEFVTTVCGLTEDSQIVTGKAYCLKVADLYRSMYCN